MVSLSEERREGGGVVSGKRGVTSEPREGVGISAEGIDGTAGRAAAAAVHFCILRYIRAQTVDCAGGIKYEVLRKNEDKGFKLAKIRVRTSIRAWSVASALANRLTQVVHLIHPAMAQCRCGNGCLWRPLI